MSKEIKRTFKERIQEKIDSGELILGSSKPINFEIISYSELITNKNTDSIDSITFNIRYVEDGELFTKSVILSHDEIINNDNIQSKDKYYDLLGNRLYPEFKIGGLNDDIFCCELYIKKKVLFGLITTYEKVFNIVTLDSLKEVSKWGDKDYEKFINKAITRYNDKVVIKEKIKKKINERE